MRARFPLLLALSLTPFAAAPQESLEPFVETDFETTETAPGQPLSLRVTVLVPTFMPEPVVFPSLEQPNLRVRLPERSTSPTSRRIGGRTWAGVSRRYELSPMVPGEFGIPPQDVTVTYADPDGGDPLEAVLTTSAVSLAGVIPAGAEDLDPFIAASSLELEQQIDGDPLALEVGDAVTRTVTAHIEGTSPVFLPTMLPAHAIDGIAAYPDQPVVTETGDGATLGGTRTERITLMAEGGGTGNAPAVELRWFDLDSGSVETAVAEGFGLSVEGAPVAVPRDLQSVGRMALIALAVIAAVVLLAAALRYGGPRLGALSARRKRERQASEAFAFKSLLESVRREDYPLTLDALEVWARRTKGADPRRSEAVRSSLGRIGAAVYGARQASADPADWRALAAALRAARREARGHPARRAALPPLNPRPDGGFLPS